MNKQLLVGDSTEEDFTSWVDLVRKGDGYLTPAQNQAFQNAFKLISRQMENTLTPKSGRARPYANFDELEERFMDSAAGESELDQDAALTAFRVLSYLADEVTAKPN